MSDRFDPESVRSFGVDRRWLVIALALALVGLIAVVVGWLLDPSRAASAYLAAFMTCLSLAVGALIFLAIIHAMDAKWPVAVRRLAEAPVTALVPLTLAFVPIALAIDDIYVWTRPHQQLSHHLAEVLAAKGPYFEPEFFWARAGVYLLSWLLVALLLRRWSARQDRDRNPQLRVRQRILGAVSLPWLALTLTFASFDWVMSLDPAWFSTIFGVYVFAGGFVAALALLTLLTVLADRRGCMAGVLRPSHYYALGRLLLAFVIFWAYISFFQFMLIWIANRPEEVVWYLERGEHGWQWIALAVVLLRFVVPFLALLSYRIKWRPRALALLAVILLVAHWLELHWMIVPAGHPRAILHWVDFGALALLGGLCLAFGLWRVGGQAAAPRWDPALPKGARYERV